MPAWSILDPPRYRERFAFAVALSLWVHGLILMIQFGTAGLGLPSLLWPWIERRVQAPTLSVRIEPARAPEPEAAAEPLPPRPDVPIEAQIVRAAPKVPALAAPTPPLSAPRRQARAKQAPAAKAPAPKPVIRPEPKPRILAQRQPQEDTFKVPEPKVVQPTPSRAPDADAEKQSEEPPTLAVEGAERKRAEEARLKAEEEARERALARQKELEAKKLEEARRQAQELEAKKLAEAKARQDAEELDRQRAIAQKEIEAKKLEEARRQEEVRVAELKKQEEARVAELKRQEEARVAELKKQEEARVAELKKQEEARRFAIESEALRRAEEAAKQAAERKKELEAKRLAEEAAAKAKEADRARAEADAAARRDAERLALKPAPGIAPGPLSGKDIAAKAIDQLRAPGGRDDLLRPPPPPGAENLRRRSIFGVERDVSLRMYVESWRGKIERNGALNYRASAGYNARNPIVTVSIRSDGSLENVFIHQSSGVRELDEAVRRISSMLAPYSKFPPDLARQYDVIDIRRVWSFEGTLRIMEEM